jgi:hypothetical protein
MSNIIGDPFRPYVKKQIEIRQNKLGQYSNIDPNTLKWYTTKTPWLRLASSVDIDDTIIKKLGIDSTLKGSELAKNFILFGGASNDKGNLQSGINFSNTLNGAYGWGGINERGFVPMPGITSANMSYYNNGALAKATIKIKAYSREQFALIDYLYMRPGYSLLLEFGHTVYLDNDGSLETWDTFYSTPLQAFLSGQVIGSTSNTESQNPEPTNVLSLAQRASSAQNKLSAQILDQYKIQEYVNKYKETKSGNYEAMIGVIHKFNWSFSNDGSYDITVELTGYGSIIESLNMNIVNPQDPNPDINAENDDPLIVINKNKNKLNEWLYSIYAREGSVTTRSANTSSPRQTQTSTSNTYSVNTKTNIDYSLIKLFKIQGATTTDGTALKTTKINYNVYVTLASLLKFIEEELLVYDVKGSNIIPYVSFNLDYDYYINDNATQEDKNFFFSPITQFSANPNICLIPISGEIFDYVNNKYPTVRFSPETIKSVTQNLPTSEKYKTFRSGDFSARLGDILLNVEFIAETLNNLTNSESNIASLIIFLENILKDVSTSLGGINNFTISHDKETNTISIYDVTPQVYENSNQEELTTINIFGVGKNQGSFITDINLDSELSNDFATATSIGAQANNFNNLSQNTFSFSQYNNGLIDRIINKRVSKEYTNEETKPQNAINYTKFLELIKNVFIERQFSQENIDALKNFNHQWQLENIYTFAKNENIHAPFFLPFNLKLTMDGLSGVRLFEKFKVSEGVLPKTYDTGEVALIIKSISHNVDTKKWSTTIETLSVPHHKDGLKPLSLSTGSVAPGSGAASTAASNASPSITTGQCGQKIILNPIPPTQYSDKRKKAMDGSFDYVFREMGEEKGMCARWTYNLAYNYIANLRGTPNRKINIPAGGNAKQENYFLNLVELNGYQRQNVAFNLNKQELRNLISTTVWELGDIIVYYANDGDGSHRVYGHTQIYVGGKSSSKWASSVRNNYGSSFIYNNRNSNCWNLLIFRAPNI